MKINIDEMNLKKVKIFVSLGLGIAGAMCFPWILQLEEEAIAYSYSFFAFFIGTFSAFAIYQISNTVDFSKRRGVLCAFLFSVILVVALVFGKQLDTVENVNIKNGGMWLAIVILTGYFTVFVVKVFTVLESMSLQSLLQKGEVWTKTKSAIEERAAQRTEETADEITAEKSIEPTWSKMKPILFTWLGLLLCWLPVFLAFYPGAFVYDAQDEYVQVATRVFTTHHPLTHVLLLGGALVFANKFFDSYNIGIAMYTIFQMVVLAGGFTYVLCFLKNHGMPKWGRILTFLFFGFFPIIPMYGVCSSKDTLFTLAVVIVFCLLLEYSWNEKGFLAKKGYSIAFVIFSIGMMLLRNNGVYAYIVFLLLTGVIVIVHWIVAKKECEEQKTMPLSSKETIGIDKICFWKKGYPYFMFLMLISVIGYLCISNLLAFVLDADSTGKQEILTVPIQQIARTYEYAPEVFTEEQKEILYEVLSEEALATYTPNISDIIKTHFNNEAYLEDSQKYQKLWLEIGLQKPIIYTNAWFLTSYGYWYPDTIINVYGGTQRFTYMYEDSSFFGFETELPGERDSKFPWLEEIYRKLSLEIYQQKVPVLSML
ncbi:MAG: DUF6020 family protein, partial [Eubacteriales bacterium]